MHILGWQELTIILVIVVIIFGAGKLPEIGGAVGKSIKEFKANTEDDGEKLTAGQGATMQSSSPEAETSSRSSRSGNPSRQQMRADQV